MFEKFVWSVTIDRSYSYREFIAGNRREEKFYTY